MALKIDHHFIMRYGEWALVAGAAEGIGAAFSTRLAEKGVNLVMIDIVSQSLQKLSAGLESGFGIKTITVNLDLAGRDAVEVCAGHIKNIDCRLLVYVPAYSCVKPFKSNTSDELDCYVDLNVRTPLHLIKSFTDEIKLPQTAGIILMSSLAGLKGPEYSAPYAATKAFSIQLSEGLFYEFKKRSIDVLSCCAGMTDTPAFWSSNPKVKGKWPGVMNPLGVADNALKNLGKKPVCISGRKNRLSFFIITRLLSRKTAVRLVAKNMEAIYPDLG